jgi:hypothetical protein
VIATTTSLLVAVVAAGAAVIAADHQAAAQQRAEMVETYGGYFEAEREFADSVSDYFFPNGPMCVSTAMGEIAAEDRLPSLQIRDTSRNFTKRSDKFDMLASGDTKENCSAMEEQITALERKIYEINTHDMYTIRAAIAYAPSVSLDYQKALQLCTWFARRDVQRLT